MHFTFTRYRLTRELQVGLLDAHSIGTHATVVTVHADAVHQQALAYRAVPSPRTDLNYLPAVRLGNIPDRNGNVAAQPFEKVKTYNAEEQGRYNRNESALRGIEVAQVQHVWVYL